MVKSEVVESQLRQIFISVAWTHKIQEKQADIYLKNSKIIDVTKIILSAVTSSGIIAAIFYDDLWLKIITAIISAVSLFISTYCKTYDLKVLHKQHKDVALELLELREDLISILCDIKMSRYTENELLDKRDELLKRKIMIAKRTPDPSEKAVNLAWINLNQRKDNTYSDDEIDSCLPIEARKK